MVKVRGRNSNGKTVKQTAENWHVRGFVTSWCHAGATSQSWQGHATESRYSWSAGISPRQVMTWCWHDDDCDRHLAHHRDAVQSRCFEPWPDVTGNFRNFLVCRLLVGKFRSWTAPMVCSRQSIGWGGLWRSCCPSCQIFGAVRFEPKRSFLDSPRERRCSCAVDFWHIVVKPRRRKTNRTYYRFWKSRWNNELRCIGFGWLRSPISINQESEDNIELFPLYHVPCVTRCTLWLSCQTTLTKRQKKKKNVRCQCTTKPTQVSSFSESQPSHGRARHQIRDWSESGRSRELLTPGTMTHAGRAASSPEIFRPFLTVCLTVFPFEFRPRTFTIGFYEKKSFISELMILECSFPLRYRKWWKWAKNASNSNAFKLKTGHARDLLFVSSASRVCGL